MIYRCILPNWASEEYPNIKRVAEGQFSDREIQELNQQFYNIYFLPNHPRNYDPSTTVVGSQVDDFRFVFADMDLKEKAYESKDEFIRALCSFPLTPTRITDSGNGIHVYWEILDLDAMSFLRLQRRIIRHFNTDEAVGQIFQLMRVPGTVNTKNKDDLKLCEVWFDSDNVYTCEDLDKVLPTITRQDEAYCKQHFDKTYGIHEPTQINDKIPDKFLQLIKSSKEIKDIWSGNVEDRSAGDYRMGHIMHAHGFTRDEALSVLVNSAKAVSRAPVHRVSYSENIVDKIWTFEGSDNKDELNLSSTVKSILQRSGDTIKGIRFPCHRYLDATAHGFRLGQVIGLVAGVGVGKTAVALNMFEGFVHNNPDYDHFFVPLEQPANEIADRWKTMCGENTQLHDKVHVISNYAEDGSFRHLSLGEIKDYILKFQQVTKRKVGCVVIDHIGALKKQTKDGENQGIMDICHEMKAFAIQTNTMLVMQSQSSREKAGIGDLELDKDAAYGTIFFESYCDYLVTMWQPLKRCYNQEGCPSVTAFKFCKIRHKKKGVDEIQEDTRYCLMFDSATERLRTLTQTEEKSFEFWNNQSTNLRKKERKTDVVMYTSIKWNTEEGEATDVRETNSSKDSRTVSRNGGVF